MTLIIGVVVVFLMIAGCYILSGSSLVDGTVFERKSTVGKPADKK